MTTVNIASSVVLFFCMFSMTIGTGGSSEYGRLLGEQKPEDAKKLIKQNLFIFLVIGTVMSVLCLVFFPLLAPLLSKDPEIVQGLAGDLCARSV